MSEYSVPAGHIGIYDLVLTANQVDTVTFEGVDLREVEILTDGAADIYVTFDGQVPAVRGTHCWKVPAVAGSVVLPNHTEGETVVNLISVGTPVYSVSRAA